MDSVVTCLPLPDFVFSVAFLPALPAVTASHPCLGAAGRLRRPCTPLTVGRPCLPLGPVCPSLLAWALGLVQPACFLSLDMAAVDRPLSSVS